MTCAFTGHRPEKLPWGADESDVHCEALKKKLDETLEYAYSLGCRNYLCGMARGCDMYFFDAVEALKLKHPDVTLEAVIPYEDQSVMWGEFDIERWESAIRQSDAVTLMSQKYTKDCYKKRNEAMVDRADLIISIYDGQNTGGTAHTVNYAEGKGVRILPLWR